MGNSRRDFLKFTSGLLSATTLLSTKRAQAFRSSSKKIPVIQGGTSESSTTLVIILPADQSSSKQIQVEIFNSEGFMHKDWKLSEVTLFSQQARLFHVDVQRLEANLSYELVLFIDGRPIEQRFFQSFAPRSRTLILGSCSNESIRQGQKEIWGKIESTKSDAFFYIGDAVYADSAIESALGTPASVESAHRRYISTLKSLPHYFREKLVPQFHIWDDHDYGWNGGDENHPHRLDMQKMFRVFFPQKFGPTYKRGGHLSFSIQVNGIQYLFIDGRSERNYSAKQNKYISNETKNWILESIQSHQGPSAIVTGSQLCGFGTNRDSIEQAHPADFNWFKNCFESQSSVLFFISGDTHYSHLQTLQWGSHESMELTSSGLHSYNFTGSGKRDPSQGQKGYYKGVNFCTLWAEAKGHRVQGRFSCTSLRGAEFSIPFDLG